MRYLVYALFFVAVFCSCTNQETDIFTTSAAARMNLAINEDLAAFTAAQNGWAMEYFATPQSPGYTLLVKFKPSGQAIVSGKNELTNGILLVDSSLYQIIADNGPVLTFDTYNKVLHAFSNPENPDGYGLEGDYEFVVISKTVDQIVLKGKKRGSNIILNKIPVNTSWEQYTTELQAMDALLFAGNAQKLTMSIGSSIYSFTNGANHLFSIVKLGSGLNEPIEVPFVITRSGIRFHTEQEIGGAKFQTFTLSADKASLVSANNTALKISGTEDLGAYFTSNIFWWEFVPTELSVNIKTLYDKVLQSCVTKLNATELKMAIRYYTTRKSFELTLRVQDGTQLIEGNLDIALSTYGKNILLVNPKVTGDATGLSFVSDIAGFKEFADVLAASFSLSTNSMLNPQKIKFTKSLDANTWFYLQNVQQ